MSPRTVARGPLRLVSALLVAGALVAGATACSSSDPQAPPEATTADASTTTTAGATDPSTTAPPTEPPLPEATLPERAAAAYDLPNLDNTERGCLVSGVNGQVAATPALADSDDALAAVVGSVLAGCVPPPKLAQSIGDAFTTIPPGDALSPGQQQCVRSALATGDLAPYATFVGGVAMARPATIKAGAVALDQACGTTMATS